ncbi:Very-long-chain 3-oxoacyl-CoA reductase 1 [Hibiscus syriacus]|uniref:Very-long-chain 3-oxoacyl-CoA reductase 1 n=1 Tax=Hibiscus syriacus TaxID=106335 RepID=A0A6A3ARD4_HIBSY|nr:very-long-chain 3-oxoacyl-CoA reductase-like protein At1g24470 [Hibiscus syriacus]KAE8705499.1 Very-long-chain 3-oxoacyl-CoA reductase 1 [Hibiscus syriacus]
MQHLWLFTVSFLGLISFLNHSFSLLKWVFTTIFRAPKDLSNYGSWAIVTGATDGIGKAFADQLARRGLNLILLSRNPDKLKTVSTEIQEKFPLIKIKVVAHDFSRGDASAAVGLIEEAVKGVEVGVLINNVGVTYPKAMYLHEVGEEVVKGIIRVNLEGTTWVSRAVLLGMISRKRGAVVNVGSGASVVVPSHPLYTIYAATKAYVDQLSISLYVEYKPNGIDVQCQVPLYVATNLASKVALIHKSSMFVPSPKDYAKAAIRQIGYEARCTPYWSHALQWCFTRFLPDALLDAWRLSVALRRRPEQLFT